MTLKAQTKWRWGVAIYLLLIGVGAGAYVVGVAADLQGADWSRLAQVGVALGFPCCAIAGSAKLTQLGRPQAAWRAWMKPGTSWIARGTLILGAFMLVSFLHLVLWLWPFAGALAETEGARHALGVVGGVLGIALMLYSGILLTAVRPIAFWSTALLPLLFLLSGLLTGAMAVVLAGLLAGEPFAGPVATLQQWVVGLLVLKAIFLGIFLQSSHRVSEARASLAKVLAGDLAPLFWGGVAVLGLLVPLALGFLSFEAAGGLLAGAGAVCGLLGGLFLRQVVLAGGIHAPLRAGSFEVALPII